jgi:sulfoxide reductase heme-binding subunit YedZ
LFPTDPSPKHIPEISCKVKRKERTAEDAEERRGNNREKRMKDSAPSASSAVRNSSASAVNKDSASSGIGKRASAILLKLKPVVFVICLLPAVQIGWNLYQVITGAGDLTDLGANPIQEVEILTGLWTLRFLAITLAVTPVRQTFNLGVLAKYRRMFGLFTFFYACLHVSMWVGVDWFFDFRAMWDEVIKHKYIFVGMATFLTLVPLALTSTNAAVRRLGGARWAKLHRLVYLAAIGGTVHYLWAVKKDTFFPLAYLATFSVLLGYRVLHVFRNRRSRARAAGRQGVDGARRAAAH